jgi:hypothetical protein
MKEKWTPDKPAVDELIGRRFCFEVGENYLKWLEVPGNLEPKEMSLTKKEVLGVLKRLRSQAYN